MKASVFVLCFYGLMVIADAVKSTIYAPLHVISFDDITPSERRQIAYLEQKLERAKRSGADSGSGAILNLVKNSIGNTIKKKLTQIARASVAASGQFSKTSSHSEDDYHHYPHYHEEVHHHEPHHHEPHHHEPTFDFWYLKKSVLNTLLQAVKAIKGGVIAIKGQLIKGGGKLVSASGKLVSAKGEAITTLGKNIAMNAILVPYHASSSKGAHYTDHGEVEAHYPGPSSHEEIYHGDSSGPGYDYHQSPVETHQHQHQHPYHEEGAGGLLILKKVSDTHRQEDYHQEQHVHERQSASASSIFSKLLSASSSLDPHKPQLYGDSYRENELVPAPSEHKPREVVQKLKPAKQQSFINQLPTQKPLNEENSYKYGNQFAEQSFMNQMLTQKPLNEENGFKYGNQFVEPAVRPLSLYLESPKLENLQPIPNDTGSNLDYVVSPLSELGSEQQVPSNQPYFYKFQTSQEMSIVPSISYEIKQNARRRIT